MQASSRLRASALTIGLGMALWGCGTDLVDSHPDPVIAPNPAVGLVNPQFDPTAGNPSLLPLPNDLLRNPGTSDPSKAGLVDQFPNTPQFAAEPFASLKTIRGFSTAGNILIPFDGRIDANSVNAQTVLLVEGPASNAPAGESGTNATIACNLSVINSEQVGVGNSTILMQPVRPLKPLTNYFVVVTNQIQAAGRGIGSGRFTRVTKVREPLITPAGNFVFPVPNDSATALEPLRQFYQPIWQRAESILGRDRSEIALAFRFGTQPLLRPLATLRARAEAQNKDLGGFTDLVPGIFPTAADFFAARSIPAPSAGIGRIAMLRVRSDNFISPEVAADGRPIGNFVGSGLSDADPIQVQQADKLKNTFLILPSSTPLGSPPPVVIFQHGFTRDKNDVFAVASSLCGAGFAVLSTDLVGHGDDTPMTTPPLGSGRTFINLGSPRNMRDNFRQSAVNLFYVARLAQSGKIDTDGVVGSDISTSLPLGYLGHSFGATVGSLYAAYDPRCRNAVFNVAGGRLTDLGLQSPTFRAEILAGLAARGIQPDTEAFRQFGLIIQTVLDDGDCFNSGVLAMTGSLKGGATTRVLQQESAQDDVIPATASRDLARSLGQFPGFAHVRPILQSIGLTEVNAPQLSFGFFQFPNSQHGAILDPTQGNTAAIRTQAIRFLATGLGGQPEIINPLPVPRQTQPGGIPYQPPVDFRPF